MDLRYLTTAISVSLFVYSGIDTEPLQYATAQWVENMLHLMGLTVPKAGYTFHVGTVSAMIVKGCVVWPAISLFVGLIVATPGPSALRKIAALAASVALLTAGNVLRLASMFYMMEAWGVGFRLAHDVIGQLVGLVIVILAAWVAFYIVPETEDKLREIIPWSGE
ncbi:archaeosortase/exosortase family protein [Methanopyrus sp.]